MHKLGHTRGALVHSYVQRSGAHRAGVRYPLLRYRGSLTTVGAKPTKSDNALSFYDPNFLGARPGAAGRARQQQQNGHEKPQAHALAGDHGRARVVVVGEVCACTPLSYPSTTRHAHQARAQQGAPMARHVFAGQGARALARNSNFGRAALRERSKLFVPNFCKVRA